VVVVTFVVAMYVVVGGWCKSRLKLLFVISYFV
jgi:hypothetical protein